jgi:hypothetical protein
MADTQLGIDESSEQLSDASDSERRLFTQSFDLSVQTVLEQWQGETLLLPEIQREYLWSDARASRLVESMLLNIPIPLLYFAETADAKWEIFDGHQRVRSVVRFVEDELTLQKLEVLAHHNGNKYTDLSAQEQRQFMRRMLRAVVITADSHPSMKYEIFERLNTGSIVLNSQELRNSLYRGPFNDLLHDLARYEPFRVCIGTKDARRRMVDEELVLRFFALRERLSEYRPPLKTFLNRYMELTRVASDGAIRLHAELFTTTSAAVAETLGSSAFRQLDSSGNALDRAPNRALFDAQMLAFSWLDDQVADQDAVISAIAHLTDNVEFLDASMLATSDRTRTLLRVRLTVEALASTGLKLDAPPIVRPS